MSDIISEVTITPVQNGFFVYVSGSAPLRKYVAASVEQLAAVLREVFPAAAKYPLPSGMLGGITGGEKPVMHPIKMPGEPHNG